MFRILFEFRPEPLVRSRDLPFYATGQLRGKMIPNTKFGIHALCNLVTLLVFPWVKVLPLTALRCIPIGQLGLSQCSKLLWRGVEA